MWIGVNLLQFDPDYKADAALAMIYGDVCQKNYKKNGLCRAPAPFRPYMILF